MDKGNDQDRKGFNNCLNDSCLVDLRYIGIFFNWCNKRFGLLDFTQRKLDRAVVNQEWLDSFPISYANFKPAGISDHSPISINIDNVTRRKGRQFIFFNFLTTLENFIPTVQQSWYPPIEGNAQFQLVISSKD